MSLAHTHNGADLGKDPVRRLLFQLALPSNAFIHYQGMARTGMLNDALRAPCNM